MGLTGKILLIVGIVGLVISMPVLCISTLLPVVSDGKTSWEEAMVGIIPGSGCTCLSFLLALVGLVLLLIGMRKPAEPEERSRRDRD